MKRVLELWTRIWNAFRGNKLIGIILKDYSDYTADLRSNAI